MPALDDAFGIHARAVSVRAARAELLATNMANADTPGYRARDIDFKDVFGDAAAGLATSHSKHQRFAGHTTQGYAIKYRQPLHGSLDQNTVDAQAERAEFLDNALRYQASITFLNGRISGLLSALRGE